MASQLCRRLQAPLPCQQPGRLVIFSMTASQFLPSIPNNHYLACRTPAMDARPSSPTSSSVTLFPAAGMSGPYTITAVPVAGGKPITVTCLTLACTLGGLSPGTAYSVSAVGTLADGSTSPASPAQTVATPPMG